MRTFRFAFFVGGQGGLDTPASTPPVTSRHIFFCSIQDGGYSQCQHRSSPSHRPLGGPLGPSPARPEPEVACRRVRVCSCLPLCALPRFSPGRVRLTTACEPLGPHFHPGDFSWVAGSPVRILTRHLRQDGSAPHLTYRTCTSTCTTTFTARFPRNSLAILLLHVRSVVYLCLSRPP